MTGRSCVLDGLGGRERQRSTGGRDEQRPEDGGRGALALRALAHPLRWKLIDVLGSEDAATATRCAEVLGESVASCAYHLGILAKYGYIEPVPDHAGREKPWRMASYEQMLSSDGLGVEGELAARGRDGHLPRSRIRADQGSLAAAEPGGARLGRGERAARVDVLGHGG